MCIRDSDGYVTLTHVVEQNGAYIETDGHTGIPAWKYLHHDGTLTYTQLRGNIEFHDVDFGYTEKKLVLHNIELYAKPGQKIAFVGATGAGKTTITNPVSYTHLDVYKRQHSKCSYTCENGVG